MAKVLFPDQVDNFNFTQTREEWNLLTSGERIGPQEILYMLHELEKKYIDLVVGTSISTDTAESATPSVDAATITTLSNQIATLQSAVDLLPAYLSGSGAPASTLGKNGDRYWDTVGLIGYDKLGGMWRQVG
jgi:hypothetical protein